MSRSEGGFVMRTRVNRRQMLQGIGAGAIALAGLTPRIARAADDEEEEILLAKVPEVVRKGADKAVPGAKWAAAYLVKEDDEKLYELEGKDSKGRDVVATITPEGTVEDVTTEIPLKEVPESVKEALKGKMPRFKPTTAYEISEEGKVTGYDFEGRRPKDKHDISVYVSADGKTIEIDEDE